MSFELFSRKPKGLTPELLEALRRRIAELWRPEGTDLCPPSAPVPPEGAPCAPSAPAWGGGAPGTDMAPSAPFQASRPALRPQAAPGTAKSAPRRDGAEHILAANAVPVPFVREESLEELLKRADAGFSETLLTLIDRSGERDAAVYKRANIDRKLFSKIRSNPGYRPTKTTALALAVALRLDLAGTRDLIGRAGYALTHSSKLDIIVEYFIERRVWDLDTINGALYEFDQPLLGSGG